MIIPMTARELADHIIQPCTLEEIEVIAFSLFFRIVGDGMARAGRDALSVEGIQFVRTLKNTVDVARRGP